MSKKNHKKNKEYGQETVRLVQEADQPLPEFNGELERAPKKRDKWRARLSALGR